MTDPYQHLLTHDAPAPLDRFNQHGVLNPADVHLAAGIGSLTGESRPEVHLAVALAVRAVRMGSACLDLGALPTGPEDPRTEHWAVPADAWPGVEWQELLAGSPVLTTAPAPLHLDGPLLYLNTYWRDETIILEDFIARTTRTVPGEHAAAVRRYFPSEEYRDQREAALRAAGSGLSIITGGPGTGKTTTVARFLGALFDLDPDTRVALAAPTGKAAARMAEALAGATADPTFPPAHRDRIAALPATTIHRLLSYHPAQGFRHDADSPLPHDVVILDETSMVPLTLMARVVQALKKDTRLVLVGDPHQLASVEVGVVLADLVEGLRGADTLAELTTNRRFGAGIAAAADAVRQGDSAGLTELLNPPPDAGQPRPVGTLPVHDLEATLLPGARRLFEAATTGDADAALRLMQSQQLLCAHVEGPHGVTTWNERIRHALAKDLGVRLGHRFAGQPVLVTRNDYARGLYNGDTGLVIRRGDHLHVAFRQGAEIRELPLTRLSDLTSAYAITVHRSQGSQFEDVYLLLPPGDSRILSRELLYTGITRASRSVRVIGEPAVWQEAVQRQVERASGLAGRLQRARTDGGQFPAARN